MAILTGFAIMMQGLPWEHTYVLSDEGLACRCWGRYEGGRVIAQAEGDAVVARCLSEPQSQAGIEYGVTGVCHQTANRILYYAGLLVDLAKGYRLSQMWFGTYGLGEWPQRVKCGPLVPLASQSHPERGAPGRGNG